MSWTISKSAFCLACLVCPGHNRRLQLTTERNERSDSGGDGTLLEVGDIAAAHRKSLHRENDLFGSSAASSRRRSIDLFPVGGALPNQLQAWQDPLLAFDPAAGWQGLVANRAGSNSLVRESSLPRWSAKIRTPVSTMADEGGSPNSPSFEEFKKVMDKVDKTKISAEEPEQSGPLAAVQKMTGNSWANPTYWNRQYITAQHVGNSVRKGDRVIELGKDAKNLYYLQEPKSCTLIIPPSNEKINEQSLKDQAIKLGIPIKLYSQQPLDEIPLVAGRYDSAVMIDMLDGAPKTAKQAAVFLLRSALRKGGTLVFLERESVELPKVLEEYEFDVYVDNQNGFDVGTANPRDMPKKEKRSKNAVRARGTERSDSEVKAAMVSKGGFGAPVVKESKEKKAKKGKIISALAKEKKDKEAARAAALEEKERADALKQKQREEARAERDDIMAKFRAEEASKLARAADLEDSVRSEKQDDELEEEEQAAAKMVEEQAPATAAKLSVDANALAEEKKEAEKVAEEKAAAAVSEKVSAVTQSEKETSGAKGEEIPEEKTANKVAEEASTVTEADDSTLATKAEELLEEEAAVEDSEKATAVAQELLEEETAVEDSEEVTAVAQAESDALVAEAEQKAAAAAKAAREAAAAAAAAKQAADEAAAAAVAEEAPAGTAAAPQPAEDLEAKVRRLIRKEIIEGLKLNAEEDDWLENTWDENEALCDRIDIEIQNEKEQQNAATGTTTPLESEIRRLIRLEIDDATLSKEEDAWLERMWNENEALCERIEDEVEKEKGQMQVEKGKVQAQPVAPKPMDAAKALEEEVRRLMRLEVIDGVQLSEEDDYWLERMWKENEELCERIDDEVEEEREQKVAEDNEMARKALMFKTTEALEGQVRQLLRKQMIDGLALTEDEGAWLDRVRKENEVLCGGLEIEVSEEREQMGLPPLQGADSDALEDRLRQLMRKETIDDLDLNVEDDEWLDRMWNDDDALCQRIQDEVDEEKKMIDLKAVTPEPEAFVPEPESREVEKTPREKIMNLKELLAAGLLTQEEFDKKKEAVLSSI